MKSPATRLMMGIASLLCLVGGGVVFWQGGEGNASILLRAGLVLGAIWFAWPVIIKVETRWMVPAIVGLLLAVTRPALLLWVLPLLVALGLLRRRTPPPVRRKG